MSQNSTWKMFPNKIVRKPKRRDIWSHTVYCCTDQLITLNEIFWFWYRKGYISERFFFCFFLFVCLLRWFFFIFECTDFALLLRTYTLQPNIALANRMHCYNKQRGTYVNYCIEWFIHVLSWRFNSTAI